MITAIWIVKGLLAFLFVMTGIFKLTMPKAKLLEKGMKGLVNISDQQIKGIGFLEILGALGIVLPGLLDFYPVLSGIAAVGLGLTMIVAARIHQQLHLSFVPNLVILILCLFVAYTVFM